MTERDYLERRSEAVKRRLRRRAAAVGDEVERAVTPLMREHPRKGLAAGAAAGVVLGAAVAPSGTAARRGPVSGLLGFLRGSAAYALRVKLVRQLLENEPETEEDGTPEA